MSGVTDADRETAARQEIADAIVEGVGGQMPRGWIWNVDKATDTVWPVVERIRERARRGA